MKGSSQLKEGIYEVSFGYNTNIVRYTTLMSGIMTLYAIPPLVLKSLMPIFNVKEVEP